MAYYNKPSNPADGDLVEASHISNVNNATEAAFASITVDVATAQIGQVAAQYWADAPEDSMIPASYIGLASYSAGVGTNVYSAKHWAEKAKGYVDTGTSVQNGYGVNIYTNGSLKYISTYGTPGTVIAYFVNESIGSDANDGRTDSVPGGTNLATGKPAGPKATIQGALDEALAVLEHPESLVDIRIDTNINLTSSLQIFTPGGRVRIRGKVGTEIIQANSGVTTLASDAMCIHWGPGLLELQDLTFKDTAAAGADKYWGVIGEASGTVLDGVSFTNMEFAVVARYGAVMKVTGVCTLLDNSVNFFAYDNAWITCVATDFDGSDYPGQFVLCQDRGHFKCDSATTAWNLTNDGPHVKGAMFQATYGSFIRWVGDVTHSGAVGTAYTYLALAQYWSHITLDNMTLGIPNCTSYAQYSSFSSSTIWDLGMWINASAFGGNGEFATPGTARGTANTYSFVDM